MEKMKNTILLITSSSIITQLVIIIISAVDEYLVINFVDAFFYGAPIFTVLGWIWLIIFIVCLVLALYLTTKEKPLASYGLAIATGVLLDILLFVVTLMVLD